MQLNSLIQNIRTAQPHLVTPFIDEYFGWADMPGHEKPYFYGKWSLKWAIWFVIETQKPTPIQIKMMIHHLLCELAAHPYPEETAQFNAITLMAFLPWKQAMNNHKIETVNVKKLPTFTAGDFTFAVNHTPDNLTSVIFRQTRADGIIHVNPETQAAAIIFRVNSRINYMAGFMAYIENELFSTEPGWKALGSPRGRGLSSSSRGTRSASDGGGNVFFINHGIQSKTPTTHTTETLKQFIQNYFK
jgi:hypothetical protein